jgi:hypothetical protein
VHQTDALVPRLARAKKAPQVHAKAQAEGATVPLPGAMPPSEPAKEGAVDAMFAAATPVRLCLRPP